MLGIAQLQDHLRELLDTVGRDLEVSGPANGSPAKRNDEGGANHHVEVVAEKHGARRAEQGVTVNQIVSEFPILRSCVARMWLRSHPAGTLADLESLIRFDEAIDRALTKSLVEFMGRLDKSRATFLGILGHDLRDPLATIIAGGKLLLEEKLDDSMRRDVSERIVATGERMHHLVGDLLDAAQARRDGQMPITRREADLGQAVRHVADEFATSHPDRRVTLSVSGDPRGLWDERRVSQAVANLVTNALRFGRADKPIDIAISADDEVTIAVHNEGPAIPKERRAALFEPLSGADARERDGRDSEHLGLGLYIAKAIARGHGGRIEVDSAADRGTTFTIHLPRESSARDG